jgi:hypothetical protein
LFQERIDGFPQSAGFPLIVRRRKHGFVAFGADGINAGKILLDCLFKKIRQVFVFFPSTIILPLLILTFGIGGGSLLCFSRRAQSTNSRNVAVAARW